MSRKINARTLGRSKGSVSRLMSPTDLGEQLKPFIFLDRFDIDFHTREEPGMYPHSGIGILSVFTNGDVQFEDSNSQEGTLVSGGFEWIKTGRGLIHGQAVHAGESKRVKGFQLWLALPPELENASASTQYIQTTQNQNVGPARVLLGEYNGSKSTLENAMDTNLLMVTLEAGQSWTYNPPSKHDVLWMSLSQGEIKIDDENKNIQEGEMLAYSRGNESVTYNAIEPSIFIIGSAPRHPYHLCLGRHSVHTSQSALFKGEKHLEYLKDIMNVPMHRPYKPKAMPIYQGYS